MKTYNLILTATAAIALQALSACSSYTDQNGRTHSVLTPAGGAILQGVLATGTGAATGALLKNQPSWMNGAISGLSGSVVSQLVVGFVPQQGRNQDQQNQYGNQYGQQYGGNQYNNQYSNQYQYQQNNQNRNYNPNYNPNPRYNPASYTQRNSAQNNPNYNPNNNSLVARSQSYSW